MDMHTTTITSGIFLLWSQPSRDRDLSRPLSDCSGRALCARARTSSRTEGSSKNPCPNSSASGPVPATQAANARPSSACAQWDVRRTYLPPPKRRDGGSDASKHPDEGLVGCAMHAYAKVVPNRDLVQHGLKAVAEVLLMPHLRATRLDVTKSGAHVCEEKYVRITDPGPPSATYLMVLATLNLSASPAGPHCTPGPKSSHRRCSQRRLNHAEASRSLAPTPKAQSRGTNPALSSTRGTRGTRQADPPDPTALVYLAV